MAVVKILSELEDSRKGGTLAKFNGFLEDYLNSGLINNEDVEKTLQEVFEAYPDFRIITEYRFNVNKQAVSNQIIRYRDIAKLPNNYFDMSFILYGQMGEKEVAICVGMGDRDVDYFLAKGMYYLLTEQYGILEENRFDVIVTTYAHLAEIKGMLDELQKPNVRIGNIQRRMDRKYFNNFEELHMKVMALAHGLKDNLLEDLTSVKDRSVVIYRNIASWFLFKKLLYVQYMTNRQLLEEKAEGNKKKHRNNAKMLVDEVPYVAFSEMWRTK